MVTTRLVLGVTWLLVSTPWWTDCFESLDVAVLALRFLRNSRNFIIFCIPLNENFVDEVFIAQQTLLDVRDVMRAVIDLASRDCASRNFNFVKSVCREILVGQESVGYDGFG